MTVTKLFECVHGARVIERCHECDQNPATALAEYLGEDGLALSVPECETVELLDEERDGPDDLVVFRDKSGAAVMWMPRRVYEWFRDNPDGLSAKNTIVHWDRSKPL